MTKQELEENYTLKDHSQENLRLPRFLCSTKAAPGCAQYISAA